MPEEYKHFSKTKPMKLEHFADCIKWWNDRYDIQDEDTDTYKAKVYTLEEIKDILKIGRNSSYNLLNKNYFKIIKLGKIVRISKKSFDNWLNK